MVDWGYLLGAYWDITGLLLGYTGARWDLGRVGGEKKARKDQEAVSEPIEDHKREGVGGAAVYGVLRCAAMSMATTVRRATDQGSAGVSAGSCR